jgi:hypothetical protein
LWRATAAAPPFAVKVCTERRMWEAAVRNWRSTRSNAAPSVRTWGTGARGSGGGAQNPRAKRGARGGGLYRESKVFDAAKEGVAH